jgi:plastocyanin
MKNKLIPAALLLILCSSLVLVFCSKGGSYGSGSNTTNNTTGSTTSGNAVLISGMQFGTISLAVKAGTTVTWTNNDNLTHTVTADDGSFTSGNLNYRDTYSHTFSSAGTYNYHCKYHSNMKANVVVN